MQDIVARDEYSENEPEKIDLEDFLDQYLSVFAEKGYKLSILPHPNDTGNSVDIEKFKDDLDYELGKY